MTKNKSPTYSFLYAHLGVSPVSASCNGKGCAGNGIHLIYQTAVQFRRTKNPDNFYESGSGQIGGCKNPQHIENISVKGGERDEKNKRVPKRERVIFSLD